MSDTTTTTVIDKPAKAKASPAPTPPVSPVLTAPQTEMDQALVDLASAKTEEDALIAKSEIVLRTIIEGHERSAAIFWINIPPQYAHWRFFRCGIRGQGLTDTIAAKMIRMGYKDAPKQVRIYGAFHADGENGRYIMAPPEVVANIQKALDLVREQKRARRRGAAAGALDALRAEFGKYIDVRAVRKGKEVDPAEIFDAATRGR